MSAYVEPNIKAALSTMASFYPDDNVSDHLREAVRRYIEAEEAALSARALQGDVVAQRRLDELRAAYKQ